MADLQEKLDKAVKKRDSLLEQRKKLDEKIKKAESDVDKFQGLINQKKFDAASDVLKVNGITIDDVISAVSSGNVSYLQELMENNKKDAEQNTAENTEEMSGMREGE